MQPVIQVKTGVSIKFDPVPHDCLLRISWYYICTQVQKVTLPRSKKKKVKKYFIDSNSNSKNFI